jgi:hypothetical protein
MWDKVAEILRYKKADKPVTAVVGTHDTIVQMKN